MAVRFDGSDYVPAQDDDRLGSQLARVKEVTADGRWRSLREISVLASAPQSSVSAQLRHLRKARFGGHDVQKRHLGHGLWLYRVQPPVVTDTTRSLDFRGEGLS